jgi:hypothetical protein
MASIVEDISHDGDYMHLPSVDKEDADDYTDLPSQEEEEVEEGSQGGMATVCKPREFGGLGLINTRLMNISLMLKWIWKLYQGAEGLWADLIRAKYLRGNDLFSPVVPTKGSQFWNAIQKIKWYFKLGARHSVADGRRTYFWLDWWTGRGPLRDLFPRLFQCCDSPFATVAGVRDANGWRIRFRRQFGLAEIVEWDNLCREIHALPSSRGQCFLGA